MDLTMLVPVRPGQEALHAGLRAAIREGTLGAGVRLPSTRALAAELGIARNTVLYAYEQLASEGYLVAGPRGTTVSSLATAALRKDGDPAATPLLSRRASALGALRAPSGQVGAFAPGVPALDQFPLDAWRRAVERAWRTLGAADLNYGEPEGEPALREAVATHLRVARAADCDASQVFITSGTQASLALCAHAFADAGDTVWMESPGYTGAHAAFEAAQLSVHGISTDADGIDVGEDDWRLRKPALVYTTPSHQYPTGGVLPLERRMSLVQSAAAHGALVIEDDYDSEFRHDGPPLACMQGMVPGAPVVYLGTFSKTMFPGLRIGFMVVPRSIAPRMARLMARSMQRGRAADQLALAGFIEGGQFALHLRRMRRLYRQRRDALIDAVGKHMAGRCQVHGESAGMHLALRLADQQESDQLLYERAGREGLLVPALSAHRVRGAGSAWNGLVLGYAQVPAERMDGFIRRLARLSGR